MFPSTPFVKLGQNFRHLAELLRRFGSIPDILELDHLSVSGDVTFGKQVSSSDVNKTNIRSFTVLEAPSSV